LLGSAAAGSRNLEALMRKGILTIALLSASAHQIAAQTRSFAGPNRSDTTVFVNEGTSLIGTLSPDGKKIALIILGQVFIADRASGTATPLFGLKDPGEYDLLAWSPDSRSVAINPAYQNPTGLLVVDIATGKRTCVTTRSTFESLAWTPSGRLVVSLVKGDSIELRSYRPVTGSDATTLATVPAASAFFSLTPDEHQVVFASPVSNSSTPLPTTRIWKLDLQSRVTNPLTAPESLDNAPSVSPDGQSIAFISERDGSRQLWTMNIDGTNRRRLTRDVVNLLLTPKSWTPDSKSILFAAAGRLHEVSTAGGEISNVPFKAPFHVARWTGLTRPMLATPGEIRRVRGIVDPAISPDGTRVAFSALGDLWVASLPGGTPRRVTHTPMTDEAAVQWAPDGRRVAFRSMSPGKDPAIEILDLSQGATPRRIGVDGIVFSWSGDGTRIAYRTFNAIGWIDVRDGAVHRIAPLNAGVSSLAGWAGPDGILFSTVRTPTDSTNSTHAFHNYFVAAARDSALPQPRDIIPRVPASRSAWSADLSKLAFVRADRGYWRDSSTNSESRLIPDPSPRSFSWTADRRKLLYLSNGRLRLLNIATGRATTIDVAPTFKVPLPPAPVVIRGARVIDGRGTAPTRPSDVFVSGGRISRIVPTGTVRLPAGTRVVDGFGQTLLPGLFDLHVHLFSKVPSPGYMWHGVTSVRDLGARGEWIVAQRERAESGALSPRIFGAGGQVTGLYELGNSQWTGREEAENDSRSVSVQVASLAANGAQIIKTYFHNHRFDALASEVSHAAGLPMTSHFISPGAIARGLEGKEHSNTYYGVDFTEPWMEDMISLAKTANTCVTPTLALYTGSTRGHSTIYPFDSTHFEEPAAAVFVSPAERKQLRDQLRTPLTERARAVWERRFRDDLASVGRMANAGVRIGAGTDTGPEGRSLQIELELLVKAGLTPLQAIRAATYDAATCAGVENSLGSVEVGKVADLVLVTGDPSRRIQDASNVKMVFFGGTPITRDQLKSTVGQGTK
jgi:Tol biopolymer transport system component